MENFRAIKRKYFITALVASVALGVFAGVALTCALAVVFKLTGVNFFWALYIPVAVVISASFAALFFFILRPTDEKIAKKLDGDFGLGQKVQTMVEFSSAEGTMIELQREQTESVLGEVAKKRVDLSWLLKFLFIPVLALAMLFAGIFVPANKYSDGDAPYDITQAQKTALTNLINETKSSDLEDNLKASTVGTLEGLLEGLESAQAQSVMKRAVISAVKLIDGFAAAADSYIKIVPALKADDALGSLADSINRGATFFAGNSGSIVAITSFEMVKDKESASDGEVAARLEVWQEDFAAMLKADEDGDIPLPVSQAVVIVREYSEKIRTQLERTGYSKGQDGLADALYALTEQFDAMTVTTAGVGDKSFFANATGACAAFADAASEPLCVQSYNILMDLYIRFSLSRIFNINMLEFGESQALLTVKTEQGNDPGSSSTGSKPGEDITFAGDDYVLDKDTGELVPYSKLYDTYKNIIDSYMGKCSDEVAIYLRQYFDLLFNGIKKEDN